MSRAHNEDQALSVFEFCTTCEGMLHQFEAHFIPLPQYDIDYAVKMSYDSEKVLRTYPRGLALCSLLCTQIQKFESLEAFAMDCCKALGDNVDTVDLAGSIYVNGMFVDEFIVTDRPPRTT